MSLRWEPSTSPLLAILSTQCWRWGFPTVLENGRHSSHARVLLCHCSSSLRAPHHLLQPQQPQFCSLLQWDRLFNTAFDVASNSSEGRFWPSPWPLPGFPRQHEEPFTDVTLHAPTGVVRIPLLHQQQLSLGTLLPFPHLCSGSHHCLFLGRVSHCNPDWHGIGYVARLSLLLLPQPPRAGIKYEPLHQSWDFLFPFACFSQSERSPADFFSGLCVSSHWDTFY